MPTGLRKLRPSGQPFDYLGSTVRSFAIVPKCSSTRQDICHLMRSLKCGVTRTRTQTFELGARVEYISSFLTKNRTALEISPRFSVTVELAAAQNPSYTGSHMVSTNCRRIWRGWCTSRACSRKTSRGTGVWRWRTRASPRSCGRSQRGHGSSHGKQNSC